MNDDSLPGVLAYADVQPTGTTDNMSSAIRAIPVWAWIAFCDAINPDRMESGLCQVDNWLGEQVVDRLSGQYAEVLAYDHTTGKYKIEFLEDYDVVEIREPGHCVWRFAHELLKIGT